MDPIVAVTETAVESMIKDRKPFSAYDITVGLRSSGHKVFHANIKRIVHKLFSGGRMDDYHRTKTKYANATSPAYRYHPPGQKQDTAQGQQQPAGSSCPKPKVKDAKTILYVPSKMSRYIGLLPNGNAYIAVVNGIIFIDKQQKNGYQKVSVDKYANVRIALGHLSAAKINGQVRIEIVGQHIKVSQA